MKDIVTRLRVCWDSMTEMGNAERAAAANEIERLRAERDEARREVCNLNAEEYGATPEHHADGRGWNCFRETP
jgi:hypothetical protein